MRISFFSSVILAAIPVSVFGDDPIVLRERFSPGYQYHVFTHTDLKGELLVPVEKDKPPQPVKITGTSAIEYDERVVAAEGKTGERKSVRQYKTIDFRRLIGDRPQEISLRPDVKRLVVVKETHAKMPFSPDGPLTWGEIDMLRTDLFVPALEGLLPARAVAPGETWQVSEDAVRELTDMEKMERGALTAKFLTVDLVNGRKMAHISLAGELEGINEDGPNRQKLKGSLYFDIEARFICYLSLNGEHLLLDKDRRETGKVSGEFVLSRMLDRKSATLADDALAKISLAPNAENTLLLYEEPELGVRFLHPRNWRVGRVARGQITLDERNGSGLLITVESLDRVPHANAYLKEARGFLEKQKSTMAQVQAPVRLQNPPRELDQFAIETNSAGQRVTMNYLIARQPNAGATFAARILETERAALVKQVEAMARSLTLTRRPEAKQPSQ